MACACGWIERIMTKITTRTAAARSPRATPGRTIGRRFSARPPVAGESPAEFGVTDWRCLLTRWSNLRRRSAGAKCGSSARLLILPVTRPAARSSSVHRQPGVDRRGRRAALRMAHRRRGVHLNRPATRAALRPLGCVGNGTERAEDRGSAKRRSFRRTRTRLPATVLMTDQQAASQDNQLVAPKVSRWWDAGRGARVVPT
jgi:hypothetical protein